MKHISHKYRQKHSQNQSSVNGMSKYGKEQCKSPCQHPNHFQQLHMFPLRYGFIIAGYVNNGQNNNQNIRQTMKLLLYNWIHWNNMCVSETIRIWLVTRLFDALKDHERFRFTFMVTLKRCHQLIFKVLLLKNWFMAIYWTRASIHCIIYWIAAFRLILVFAVVIDDELISQSFFIIKH